MNAMKTGVKWLQTCSYASGGMYTISESDIDNYDDAWHERIEEAKKLARSQALREAQDALFNAGFTQGFEPWQLISVLIAGEK